MKKKWRQKIVNGGCVFDKAVIKDLQKKVGKRYFGNLDKPILEVKWKDLAPAGDESQYRRKCPACPDGILLVQRNQKTFELAAMDRCIVCGQVVKYTDIEAMRQMEGGGLRGWGKTRQMIKSIKKKK